MSAPARPPATTILQSPPRAVNLGEWCVQSRLVTREQVDACLRIQKDLAERGEKPPRLGELLLERGHIPLDGLLQALASQRREIRHCPRCRFQTTVPSGATAALYACAGCSGPLIPSPDGAGVSRDEFVVVPSRDEVPTEVRIASRTPSSRFGKYILVRELGSGGVGRVSLAWDPFLSQFVAVKRLLHDAGGRSEQDLQERRRMLLQEARSAIRLRHPGIVSVYDVGRIDDEPYISMEFVDGVTLHDRLQALIRSGATPYAADRKSIITLLVEVARALDYAHTLPSPLIHCDLKPSNVMIDREGHARLLDFGLARNLKTDAPDDAEFISGTPAYMSPEQARGDRSQMDARTDVYAFGAILYECLTGRTPFVGAAFEILHLTQHSSPERPSTALAARLGASVPEGTARIPEALESLCMACLERDPGRRPFSLEDVAGTLEALLASPPAAPSRKPTTVILKSSLSPGPRSVRRPLLTGALVLALLGLGFLPMAFALFSEPRELGRFLPEAARSLLPDRQEEIDCVRSLKVRVLDSLRHRPPSVAELRLRGGLPVAVAAVTDADSAGLTVRTGGGSARVAWDSLEPAQILLLARLALPDPSPSDRLGLAIYCLRAGLPAEARRLLDSLRGTELAVPAERYLHEVNP